MMPTRDKSGNRIAEETTLEGRVEILGDFPRGKFGEAAVKYSGLLLKTEMGCVIILLGPTGYFMKHNFQIKAGDTLKVTGTRLWQEHVPIIQAREVKNQQQQLKLRDSNGLPLWPTAARTLH
jgi:hypothetical protein|uniref:Magnetosome protein MamS/MamX domain-containing protein n=1 Tax=Desulfobacca acetoxidans TaxID=60893 RepID=A0A7V6DR43_9BACT